MNRRVNMPGGERARRGRLLWVLSAAALVSALLYWEQVALLYVLSTLAMCGLLLTVALSDLDKRDVERRAPTPDDQLRAGDDNEMAPALLSRRPRRVTERKPQGAAEDLMRS